MEQSSSVRHRLPVSWHLQKREERRGGIKGKGREEERREGMHGREGWKRKGEGPASIFCSGAPS